MSNNQERDSATGMHISSLLKFTVANHQHSWLLPLLSVAIAFTPIPSLAQSHVADQKIFSAREERKDGFSIFPQWASVIRRHAEDRPNLENCPINLCKVPEWLDLISSMKGRNSRDQLLAVNNFSNRFRYVLDQDNYGRSDYWAIPREFLTLGGDCEDFAIIKYFSLRQLGIPADFLRVVVVQDANLRIPHAVLAVYMRDDVFILDNQIHEIISHQKIAHYVPVFSLNERNWWMHLP